MLNWVHTRGEGSPRKKTSTACTRWSCLRPKVAAIACMRILSSCSSEAAVIIPQKTLSAKYLPRFEPNFDRSYAKNGHFSMIIDTPKCTAYYSWLLPAEEEDHHAQRCQLRQRSTPHNW